MEPARWLVLLFLDPGRRPGSSCPLPGLLGSLLAILGMLYLQLPEFLLQDLLGLRSNPTTYAFKVDSTEVSSMRGGLPVQAMGEFVENNPPTKLAATPAPGRDPNIVAISCTAPGSIGVPYLDAVDAAVLLPPLGFGDFLYPMINLFSRPEDRRVMAFVGPTLGCVHLASLAVPDPLSEEYAAKRWEQLRCKRFWSHVAILSAAPPRQAPNFQRSNLPYIILDRHLTIFDDRHGVSANRPVLPLNTC